MAKILLFLGWYFWWLFPLRAQLPNITIEPFLKIQYWNAINQDDVSSYIRRGRAGWTAQLEEQWTVCTSLQFDNAGKDSWAPNKGTPANISVKLWDLYIMWRPFRNKNSWVLTTGYTLPQLSRETVTTPWFVPSLDKARSSSFLRKFVTGSNAGISPVLNMGGVVGHQNLWLIYDVSAIQAQPRLSKADSKALLVAGRLGLGLGEKQSYSYKQNGVLPMAKNHLMVGLNVSWQEATALFSRSATYGVDVFGNLSKIKFSGELMHLLRTANQNTYRGATGFARLSLICKTGKNKQLEPSVTLSKNKFDENNFQITSGNSTLLDTGIDYYCYGKAVKASLHYLLEKHRLSHGTKPSSLVQEGIVFGLQLTIK